MAEPPTLHETPRRKRMEDHSITFKHVVYALPFILMGLGGIGVTFGTFVLSQARAEGMGALKVAEQAQLDVKALKEQVQSQDAGLRGEVAAMRQEQTAQRILTDQKFERQDSKLDAILREVKKIQ